MFVEDSELARVEADEVGRKLGEAGADAGGVGGQVEGAERTDFAVADEAVVSLDLDDGAVEYGHGLATGPGVAPFVEGQIDLVGGNAFDFHCSDSLFCGW